MGNVVNFRDRMTKEQREEALLRGYVKYRKHHHQLQIEHKRKLLEEPQESKKED